ncbi:MAG: chromate efflux transporter [Verrucomicrobiota bacterium]|nr:chromate efflux transporter [Verrucomicrobiota bacterium]
MPSEGHAQLTPRTAHPSFAEAFRFWLKLGFISFGGPAGQIAIMQTELVEKKHWISQARFLHALNFCMLLPGPEAQQLAIYVGWLLHKTAGGIAAGALFVIPSMFVLWGLSFVYAADGNVPWIAAIFYGLKPAVMAIVAFAVLRIGRKALRNLVMWGIAAAAFAGIFFLRIPFPLIVLAAGVIGYVGAYFSSTIFLGDVDHGADASVLDDDVQTPAHALPSFARALRITAVCIALWWLPILAIGAAFGWQHTLFREGIFFSKAAVVTFGGAYAVLPYVAQQAVEHYGWLAPGQMMDGLGLAETTPGPLIMVVQFVGFIGGWNGAAGMSRVATATLGALITTWATFVPCFLWVFLGAPHIERLRGNRTIGSALSAVTAAVVGVILNLAVWFALQVVFPPGRAFDWFAIMLGLVAFIGMLRWKLGVIPVVIGSGLIGLVYQMWLR